MGVLQGAYQKSGGSYEKTQLLTTSPGDYQAYFLGFSEQWTETSSQFACSLCKGKGDGRRGEHGGCIRCNGTGKKVEQKTKLRYQLQNGNVEEEVVTFKLTAAATVNGQTVKASTMFLRLRALYGKPQATAEEIDGWYSSLAEPIKVPCRVEIDWNDTGDRLVIKSVRPRQTPEGAQNVGRLSALAAQATQRVAQPTQGAQTGSRVQERAPIVGNEDDRFAYSEPADDFDESVPF